MSSNGEGSVTTFLESFQVIDFLTDLCTGVLMIALFGPLFYSLHFGLYTGTLHQLLFGIFHDFFKEALSSLATWRLSEASPWFLGAFALALGFLSRGFLAIHNMLLTNRHIGRLLARVAFWQVGVWHGLAEGWDWPKVARELVRQNPFHRVGDSKYALYRAHLESAKERAGGSKRYWDFEALCFIRSSHLYGIFLTFSIAYLVYGASIFALKRSLNWVDFGLWLGLVIAFFALTICLFEEVILHGVAFVSLDEVLGRENAGKGDRRVSVVADTESTGQLPSKA